MAWNEPGGSGDKDKNRDPWSNRPNPQGGPPDLDEVFKNLSKKLRGIFGGGRGNGTSGMRRGGDNEFFKTASPLILLLLGLWLIYDTTYILDQSERGVVLRFGKYVDAIQPGYNFRFPRPIETVQKVNVSELLQQPLKARLLTKDQNLINISLVVQFKVQDEIKYALRVRNPELSLRESTESALREVVGTNTLDEILVDSTGPQKIINDTKIQLQKIIDKFQTGLLVYNVNIGELQAPEQVQDAFQDANKASNDAARYVALAQANVNTIVPKAEAEAQRLVLEASAYKKQIIDKAEGDVSRFLQVMREYRKAPEVTRKRMYLDTVEQVLKNSTKVMVKVNKGNNILYLPIDRYISERRNESQNGASAGSLHKDEKPSESQSPSSSSPFGREREERGR